MDEHVRPEIVEVAQVQAGLLANLLLHLAPLLQHHLLRLVQNSPKL